MTRECYLSDNLKPQHQTDDVFLLEATFHCTPLLRWIVIELILLILAVSLIHCSLIITLNLFLMFSYLVGIGFSCQWMRVLLFQAKTHPSILHHYLLEHNSLLWWWMLPTVSFQSWCVLSWLCDILWDPVEELKYGDEPTFRHFRLPKEPLISFSNVKLAVSPELDWTPHLSFPKRRISFFLSETVCGVLLPSFCSSNFIFLSNPSDIYCQKDGFWNSKIWCTSQGVWYNSWYFVCLSLTVVGVWIESNTPH